MTKTKALSIDSRLPPLSNDSVGSISVIAERTRYCWCWRSYGLRGDGGEREPCCEGELEYQVMLGLLGTLETGEGGGMTKHKRERER